MLRNGRMEQSVLYARSVSFNNEIGYGFVQSLWSCSRIVHWRNSANWYSLALLFRCRNRLPHVTSCVLGGGQAGWWGNTIQLHCLLMGKHFKLSVPYLQTVLYRDAVLRVSNGQLINSSKEILQVSIKLVSSLTNYHLSVTVRTLHRQIRIINWGTFQFGVYLIMDMVYSTGHFISAAHPRRPSTPLYWTFYSRCSFDSCGTWWWHCFWSGVNWLLGCLH